LSVRISVATGNVPALDCVENATICAGRIFLKNLIGLTFAKTLSNTALIKYESHRVYVSFGTEIVPVLIEYNTLGDSSGRVYLDTVCTNLNDGTLIDYEDIC